jgi:capsular exopolysaccharide synthesis family protein
MFLVSYVEFKAGRLNSTREVNEGLGVRVLGHLPSLSGRAGRKMQSGGDAGALQALLMESIDSVRASLVHCTTVASPRVVLVTSAEQREGKTTVASQLAASLARAGRRTLLVDGDLRRPAAHLVFDVPQEPGFCEVLRGRVPRDAVVLPTQQPNLWIVPAGRCDMQSVQALAGEAAEKLLDAWRGDFDFVVLDSGPVLHVADAMLLGQHADVALLAAQRDVSRLPKVYEACERLNAVGVTVLGVVVNGVAARAAGRSLMPASADVV